MLSELVEDFFEKKNTIITSSAGNGATSLCLYVANLLLKDDNTIVYFNPLDNIEKSFVRKFYPRVYGGVLFVARPLSDLLLFLQYLDHQVDYLILDPGDCLMYNSQILPNLKNLVSGKFICTSQIRQDPSQGGQIYSTIEKKFMNKVFDYSIWLRNVTEESFGIKRKYIDVFDTARSGNNQISRYVANFTREGNIIG